MFNRFTREARDVVERAQEEAAALGHDYIGTEHLLLGVAARGGLPRVARARPRRPADGGRRLRRSSSTPTRSRRSASTSTRCAGRSRSRSGRARCPAGARRRGGHVPFCPKAKKALELALREALALGDRHIGSDHILLGMTRDSDTGAARALAACGTTPDALRAAVLAARREAA